MMLSIKNIEYTVSKITGKPIIHLRGRDHEKRRKHIRVYKFFPYFYVQLNEPILPDKRLKRKPIKVKRKNLKNKYVKKLVCNIPEDVAGSIKNKNDKGLRSFYNITYESDIPFTDRFMIDNGITSGVVYDKDNIDITKDLFKPKDFSIESRLLTIDIEVSSTETNGNLPSHKNPINQMYSIVAFDNYLQKFIVFGFKKDLKNEKQNLIYENPIFESIDNKIKILNKRNNNLLSFVKKHYVKQLENENYGEYYKKLSKEQKQSILYKIEIQEIDDKIKDLKKKYDLFKKLTEDEYKYSFYTFNNEKDMLNMFIEFVEDIDPDIITGWYNTVFDMPYLIKRMTKLKLEYQRLSPFESVWVDRRGVAHIKGRTVYDTNKGYILTQTSEKESMKLDVIGNTECGVGKVPIKIDYAYQHDFPKLIKYNIQDVFLDLAISKANNIFPFVEDIRDYIGCGFEHISGKLKMKMVDHYILFACRQLGYVLPSKKGRSGKEYPGAIVVKPKRMGVQKWVVVIDLSSLYPNIMLSLNMGEDTIVIDPKPEEIPNLIKSPVKNVYFRKNKKSLLYNILKNLLDKRKEYKTLRDQYKKSGDTHNEKVYDRLQTVVKFITNSIYGVLGNLTFRIYNKQIALSITTVGRMVIEETIKCIEDLGYENHYGDTDSIFPLLKSDNLEDAIKESEMLTKKINEHYKIFTKKFNLDENFLNMKPEKIFEDLLMVRKKGTDEGAKKKYAGKIVCVWDDEGNPIKTNYIAVKGFKKSNVSRKCITIMDKLFDMSLKLKEDVISIENYIRNELQKIKKGFYPLEEISFSKGIGKSLSSYDGVKSDGSKKSAGNWVRAASWTNNHSGLWGKKTNYGSGSKPKYVWVIPSKLPKEINGVSVKKIEMVALDDDYDLPDEIKNRKIVFKNKKTGENVVKHVSAIDYNTIIEKTIGAKIGTVLESLGIEWNSLTSKYKQKKLI